MVETKSIGLELKDVDTSKRTAVIAHAVYNNIDLVQDISCKGMFDKTWKENKSIDFLFNHKSGEKPGIVLRTFDDEEKAYTEVKFGKWTLGNDVLEMADEGAITGASFGYSVEKKEFVNIKSQRVRKLKEVKHVETSLLTVLAANPLAGIVKLQKSLFENNVEFKALSATEQQALKSIVDSDQNVLQQLVSIAAATDPKSDLYTWVTYAISRRADSMSDIRSQIKYYSRELKALSEHADKIEKFCRNAKASDECIKSLLEEKDNIEQILSEYNTSDTDSKAQPLDSIAEQKLLSTIQAFQKSLKN